MSKLPEGITPEELAKDIQHTRDELEAYEKLGSGYRTLAGLPENQGTNARKYSFLAQGHEDNARKCRDFLQHLLSLQEGLSTDDNDE